jgi:acyl-CoA synthetase (AMP-forming)/AMP-acid ligase II
VSPVAIVDPDGLAECDSGRIGEIWVAGSSVAAGYWNRPDETREAFQARLAGTGGGPFLRTGDLGFLLEGQLFVTGRLKDLIIIDGQNHYPQDIERTVGLVIPPLVAGECAAFSVDCEGTEKLVVVIGLGSRSPLAPDEVRSRVRAAIAEHHDLRTADIVIVKLGTIPRTLSGKVRRRSCKAMYLDRTLTVTEDR